MLLQDVLSEEGHHHPHHHLLLISRIINYGPLCPFESANESPLVRQISSALIYSDLGTDVPLMKTLRFTTLGHCLLLLRQQKDTCWKLRGEWDRTRTHPRPSAQTRTAVCPDKAWFRSPSVHREPLLLVVTCTSGSAGSPW